MTTFNLKLPFTLTLITVALSLPVRAAAQTATTTEYYGLDTNGSVRVIFDASGAIVSRVDYLPFGEQLAPAPGALFDRVGRRLMLTSAGETALDYAQARAAQTGERELLPQERSAAWWDQLLWLAPVRPLQPCRCPWRLLHWAQLRLLVASPLR